MKAEMVESWWRRFEWCILNAKNIRAFTSWSYIFYSLNCQYDLITSKILWSSMIFVCTIWIVNMSHQRFINRWRLILRPQILHIEFNEDQVLVKVWEITYLRWYKLSSRSDVGLNFCSKLSSSGYCANVLLLWSVAIALFILKNCWGT